MNYIEVWSTKISHYKIENNELCELEAIASGWEGSLYINRDDCQKVCDYLNDCRQRIEPENYCIYYPYKTILLSDVSPYFIGDHSNKEDIDNMEALDEFNDNIKQQVFKKVLDNRLNNAKDSI